MSELEFRLDEIFFEAITHDKNVRGLVQVMGDDYAPVVEIVENGRVVQAFHYFENDEPIDCYRTAAFIAECGARIEASNAR